MGKGWKSGEGGKDKESVEICVPRRKDKVEREEGKEGKLNGQEGTIPWSISLEGRSNGVEVKHLRNLVQLIPEWIVSIEPIWKVVWSVLSITFKKPFVYLVSITGIWLV